MPDIDALVRDALTQEARSYSPPDLADAERVFVAHRRRRRAFRFTAVTAATGVAALVVVAVVAPRPAVEDDSLPVTSELIVVETIAVPDEPLAISAGPSGIWVASRAAGEVTLVGRDGEVVRSFGLPGASEIAAGGATVWAAGQSGHVVGYDEVTLEPNFEFFNNMSASVVDMAVGGTMQGAAWSVDEAGCVIDLTDPLPGSDDYECLAVDGEVPPRSRPTDIATDDDETWVLDGRKGRLTQLKADPGVNDDRAIGTGPVPLPSAPRGRYADLLVAADSVWVSGEGGSLMRLDLETGEKTYADLGGDYADLAAGYGWVWALIGFEGSDRGTVVQVDPATGEIIGSDLTLPGKPSDITVDDAGKSGIWVTLRDTDEVARISLENGEL